MKIAIEAQRIFRTNKHGMDFVALESIRELQKIDKDNDYYILVRPGDDDSVLKATPNFHIIQLKCPTYPLWEQVALPLAVNRIKPDVLHCTSNTAPIFCKVPLVLTLHDIIFLEKKKSTSKSLYQMMGWYYRRFVVPRILKKCSKIITVSNFEADRISNALKLPANKLIAVYNGVGNHFKKVENCEKRHIFFLGNTDPKKNTERVLKAYSIYLDKSERKLPLLIADLKGPYIKEILDKISHPELIDHIIPSGYIYNSDLPKIYSEAFVFLYPSLRESFGIPILEAMACGTPVITSNTSAMPEVAGGAAILVNPLNEEEIADAILKLELDDKLLKEIVEAGIERASHFSWRYTAEELLKIYYNYETREIKRENQK